VDNALSIWFLDDDPSYKAYIDFQEKFGSDEIFIAMLPVKNAIGASEKTQLLELHEAIDALPFVKTSFSLAKAKYPIYANRKINFDNLYNTQRSEKGLKRLLSKLPNISKQLITNDFKNQFFYIQLNPTPSIEEKRQSLGSEIRSLIEKQYSNYYLTGPPVLNEAYSKGIYKESMLFGGLTVLVITMSKVDLITSAIWKSFTPCFYTTLTTFVGYFALYLSPLPAFKGFTLVLCCGIFAIFQVKTDTNSKDLLAEGKAKQDLRMVENELNGSSRLQLNVLTNTGEQMLNTEALKHLENFQNKLEVNPLINAPVSVVNIKNFLEKRNPVLFQAHVSKDQIEHTLSSVDNEDNNFFKLFSEDFTSAGITIGLKEIKTLQLEQLLAEVKRDFENTFPVDAYTLEINGFPVVFSQLNNFILETQFKSFFAAFFVAFLCLWCFIKSLRTTLLILIPNILPLTILAIFMSVLDIPLDVTTAMITPIMLGISMDDTIHLVYKYRRSKYVKGTPEIRMDNAMSYTGKALFSTTIALVGGFLIISSSAVPSVRDFGLLCAVTVAIALITDIFYLPALLKTFDK